MSARRFSARRVVAIATALVALVCTLSVQTREAAIVHVRCVEHGELTHVRGIVDRTGPQTVGSHVVGRTGTAPAEHEHCPLPAANHSADLAMTAPPAVVAAAVTIVRSVAPADYLARAPLRYAPKTSPPIRA